MLTSPSDSSIVSIRTGAPRSAVHRPLSGRLGRWLLASLAVGLFGLFGSLQAVGQVAPFAFEVEDRPARELVTLDLPQTVFLPGYFFTGEGNREYDPTTVYRIEFGKTSGGAVSNIPDLQRFQLVENGPFFTPLIRNVRQGVVAEPYDEVTLVRLLDGPETDQLQMCTPTTADGDNASDPTTNCPDVVNPNKNSYFQTRSVTSAVRTDEANASGNSDEQACAQAYADYSDLYPNQTFDSTEGCPVWRFSSERVTCFKCVLNSFALNRGGDNVFSRSGGERTRNNVGRIDKIIRDPIVVSTAEGEAFDEDNPSALLSEVGFLIVERGGNDNISVAGITRIADLDTVAGFENPIPEGGDFSGLTLQQRTDLPRLARLIRTYDNTNLELEIKLDGANDPILDPLGGLQADGFITPGRVAQSIVTEFSSLTQTDVSLSGTTCTGANTFWASTDVTVLSSVFMSSNPAPTQTGYFSETRPDQNLSVQTVCATFVSLAQLGIGLDEEFFGVSIFAGDVTSTMDLITLRDIPRNTSGESGGVGGIDLVGGGGFFFNEDTELLLDFGDAPETYGTTRADDGARHRIGGPWMPDYSIAVGDLSVGDNDTDAESDGVPSELADSDDLSGVDDERGIQFREVGSTVCDGIDVSDLVSTGNRANCVAVRVANPTANPAFLTGWVDFNGNGVFNNCDGSGDSPGVVTTTCERARKTLYVGNRDMETIGTGTCTLPDADQGSGLVELDGVVPPFCEGVVVLVWEYPDSFALTTSRSYGRFRISTDEDLDATPSPLGLLTDGEVEDHTIEPGILPVTIHAFESRWTGAGLEVTWGTVSEMQNVGFYIWGYDGKEMHLLTPEMIPSEGIDALVPQRYRTIISDPRARQMDSLAITAVDMHGEEEVYGFYRIGRAFGRDNVDAPIDFAAIRIQTEEVLAQHDLGGFRAGQFGPVIAVDFEVSERGLHRITYEQLAEEGLNLSGVKPEHLAVTRMGEPVARFVRSKGAIGGSRASAAAARDQFGPGSYLEFWGEIPEFPDARYVENYVYRVSVEPARAVEGRVLAQRVMSGSDLAYHRGSVRVDDYIGYSMSVPFDDGWVAARLRTNPARDRNHVTEVSVGPDFRPEGSARLEMVVAGGIDHGIPRGHRVRAFFNEVLVYDGRFDSLQRHDIRATVPAELIQPGINQVRLSLPGGTTSSSDIVFLDSVELYYPRGFSLRDDRLLIQEAAPNRRVHVPTAPGRRDAAAFAWNGSQLFELRSRVRSGVGVSFQTLEDAGMQYWVSTADGVLTPTPVGAVHDVDLLAEPAEFLVIAHPVFMPISEFDPHPLNDFVQQRRSEGWSVRVVDITEIQRQFGGGMALPQAVTRFLQAASSAFAPSHVLLVGGDADAYRNQFGRGALSFIPTMYRPNGIITHTPADGLLADLNGNGRPDLAIGRWPVRTLGDLESIVTKTLDWSASVSDLGSAVWVADSNDPSHPPFSRQADRMLDQLGDAGWDPALFSRILVDEADDVTAARHQLFDAIEAGATFTGFVGHGSAVGWTFQSLLLANDVAELRNEGNPTLISTASCYATYFVSPFTDSVSHRLLNGFRLDAEGEPIPGAANGAVAVQGASTRSSAAQNEFFVSHSKAGMLAGETLGESIRAALELGSGRGMDEQVRSWILLGDPTLRLKENPMGSR